MTDIDDQLAPGDVPDRKPTRARAAARSSAEWAIIIVAALVVAFLVKTFLVQVFWIPSASMEPTLHVGDRVVVNKLSYRFGEIERGDIVVFERPDCDASADAIKDLIKRVVALEGETVEGRDGAVYVNGKRLRESYLPRGVITTPFAPYEVPSGHIWVMGDNRGNSTDSRFLCEGNRPIAETSVVGRSFAKLWPLSRGVAIGGGAVLALIILGATVVGPSRRRGAHAA